MPGVGNLGVCIGKTVIGIKQQGAEQILGTDHLFEAACWDEVVLCLSMSGQKLDREAIWSHCRLSRQQSKSRNV
ncbi:hypothetical protein [Acaryochloris marina]|uniref:Uncharacterized protein n=1 Tax=Acaryochloris marina (strain MBIC 11017) TaxID=329726 RepID=B0C943_ACAM1|nr:hypothetical protein [Acaryochloris marina]ABW26578.1 hypothetical protein AM1_1554 [Acaryochloris marina MBIC11017]